jgi:hypothetical protein
MSTLSVHNEGSTAAPADVPEPRRLHHRTGGMSIEASALSDEVRAVLLGVCIVAAALAAVWASEWRRWSRLVRAAAAAAIAGASYGAFQGGYGSALFGALTLCLAGTLTMLQIGPGPPWFDRLRLTPVAHRVWLGIASLTSLWAFVTWAFEWGDPVVHIVLVLIAATAATVHTLLVLKARSRLNEREGRTDF